MTTIEETIEESTHIDKEEPQSVPLIEFKCSPLLARRTVLKFPSDISRYNSLAIRDT